MTFEYESKDLSRRVALYVADLARQKDFYKRVLGLELLEEGRTGSFGSGWTSAGEALSD